MAGKGAKRRAKAAKAEQRAHTLEMPKNLWEIVASAATLAGAVDTTGATGAAKKRSRQLTAKAEYYASEPAGAAGNVRGDLSGDEMNAFRTLIRHSKNATPQGRALAEAMRQLDGLDLEEGAVSTLREQLGQEHQDAMAPYRPASLKIIVSTLDMVIRLMGGAEEALPDMPPAALQAMTWPLASARAKLAAAYNAIARNGGGPPPPMTFTREEAEMVASAFRNLLESIRFTVNPGQGVAFGRVSDATGGEVQPLGTVPLSGASASDAQERLDGVHAVLERAVRYFTGKARP